MPWVPLWRPGETYEDIVDGDARGGDAGRLWVPDARGARRAAELAVCARGLRGLRREEGLLDRRIDAGLPGLRRLLGPLRDRVRQWDLRRRGRRDPAELPQRLRRNRVRLGDLRSVVAD